MWLVCLFPLVCIAVALNQLPRLSQASMFHRSQWGSRSLGLAKKQGYLSRYITEMTIHWPNNNNKNNNNNMRITSNAQ